MDKSIIYYLCGYNDNFIDKRQIMELINSSKYDKQIITPHNKVYFIENIVIKHHTTKSEIELDEFINEATLYLLFSDNNIGPTVLDTWYSVNGNLFNGYIITLKMDCDLLKLMENTKGSKYDNYTLKENIKVKSEAIKELKYEVLKLHDLGYIHCDLMPKNILVKLEDDTITKMTITDFGLTDKKSYVIYDTWINTLYTYHRNHYPFMEYTLNDIKVQPELLDFQIFELFNIEPNDTKII
jgi:serine/threonine protein kinase